MITGIGTDIIDIDRVGRAVEREHFRNRVFTAIEQSYCDSKQTNRAASYAARFAGKEAFFKALGTGIVTPLTEVEIVNDENGRPYIKLHGRARELIGDGVNIHVSLSHAKNYATAVCVLESLTEMKYNRRENKDLE